jgi:cytoplasmic iron level regulating protein YaaA (DUF328/UPF0246 family)
MVFALLSPAKTMSFEGDSSAIVAPAQPHFQKEAAGLVKALQAYDDKALAKLMAISAKLAALNVHRFKDFAAKPTSKATQAPAILAYQGDTYVGLRAQDFTKAELAKAQKHIGILTGLYGVLQPFDLIQPYRLEMGTGLSAPSFKNLYAFWGDRITERVNELVTEHKAKAVIGLASQEYFKAVNPQKLAVPLIQCDFKEEKNGKFQTVGLFAKRARGMMARYIVEHDIKDPQTLQGFDTDHYKFNASLSDDSQFVFTRKGQK